jgi:hypothetical protein
VLHGYSGRWQVAMKFSRWWDMEVVHPSYVSLDGYADLYVPADGSSGHGSFLAQIDAVVSEPQGSARLRSVQNLEQVSVDEVGRLRIYSTVFCREILEASGSPPDGGGFRLKLAGPIRYLTEARPVEGSSQRLEGQSWLAVGDRQLSGGPIVMEYLG